MSGNLQTVEQAICKVGRGNEFTAQQIACSTGLTLKIARLMLREIVIQWQGVAIVSRDVYRWS